MKGATDYQIWLAAFVSLLAIETEHLDVVVGSYATNRRRPELRNMIGDFANTIASLRFRCDYATSFRDGCRRFAIA